MDYRWIMSVVLLGYAFSPIRFPRKPSISVYLTTPFPDFQTSPKQAVKAKKALDESFSYLAGNAFGRDKKGRVRKDDPSELQQAAGGEGGGGEYTAYVYYEFEFE